jgi:hypothetical protein
MRKLVSSDSPFERESAFHEPSGALSHSGGTLGPARRFSFRITTPLWYVACSFLRHALDTGRN